MGWRSNISCLTGIKSHVGLWYYYIRQQRHRPSCPGAIPRSDHIADLLIPSNGLRCRQDKAQILQDFAKPYVTERVLPTFCGVSPLTSKPRLSSACSILPSLNPSIATAHMCFRIPLPQDSLWEIFLVSACLSWVSLWSNPDSIVEDFFFSFFLFLSLRSLGNSVRDCQC